ncbi:MAG: SDR family NAD(P)-dependent oxidoreductase [Pseudochelatococcus sp.]|uniref:SDR family NAD(P)-dependent oxidoreductase n=1 Tax=Pseudochelatococcus sp. TaxID=2020869 RepID=UPI003D8E0C73
MKGLKGKVVVVTGGAGGIGSATSLRFAEEGARVVVADIGADAAARVVAAIRDAGGEATALVVDLTDYEATAAAVAGVEADFGPVDVLVNNAGWDLFVPFLKSEPDFWSKIIDINLRSVLNITRPVVASMVARGTGGRVVSIGSDAGRVGSSGEAVYAACKAGVVAFSKTLAREHARHGITFNVVCPGVTETAMLENFMEAAGDKEKLRTAFTRAVPLGRLGKPEDLPGAILFLASDDAAFITGQVISVSGGLTMHG